MIIVDESDPVDEIEPAFPYRDVTIRRDTAIREAYEFLDEIGRGKFGRVYRCRDTVTGLTLAAKVVTTKRKEEKRNVEREIEIMRRLQHPRLIQLFDAIEDIQRAETCLVLEMVGGGELFDRVIQDEFILTERACVVFVRQICEAVEYIHSKSIIHLDMKPENVMCLSKNGNRIKIIDFGLARFYDPTKKLQVLFGTPEFVAPEVVNFEEIDYSTDLWSIGVITYVLLSGLSPFMGETDVETMANVTIAKYDFEDEAFDEISEDAKDFISKLLTKDKSERLTATECIKHPWLALLPSPTMESSHPPMIKTPWDDPEIPLESPEVESLEEDGGGDSDTDRELSSSYDSDMHLRSSPGGVEGEEILSSVSPSLKSPLNPRSGSNGELLLTPDPPSSSSLLDPEDCPGETRSRSSSSFGLTPSSSPSPVGQFTSSSRFNQKRGSLDLTKDHLKSFVSRWTDNPYLFDRPRGIISHFYGGPSQENLLPRKKSQPRNLGGGAGSTTNLTITTHRLLDPTPTPVKCGMNIVSQIRRFSYQLHEELQIMKSHHHHHKCNPALRKCSWGEVNAQ